ncbi:helix-turn-helix transcriptional regulator [Bradyrhizobium sp.]|uniref:helix-turn-helix transcriptional regulator n=1 Tax=Bradyrhizobium sp. TaxID=376 RepID=UPI0039E6BBC9
MEARSLTRGGQQAAGFPAICALPKLIESVGRPNFSGQVFSFARDICQADHFTAFLLDRSQRMHTIVAENIGVLPVAQERAVRYRTSYWLHDPIESVLSQIPDGDCWIVKSRAQEIEHSSYRQDCYGSVQLDKRIALSQTRDGCRLRLHFYRRSRHDFQPDEEARIADHAELLMSIVRRHAEVSDDTADEDHEQTFKTRFGVLAPSLSEREREVCGLIAVGLSSEGIALRLNISINTVLTYRKRAYSRLRISSQNELMRLVLS